ncbi:MAG: hypothetical protein M1832_000126 [Thelocarpon impressellum]|nr:MAG: hypothetical protein M1832_000126 [Thelocarpon impressellum]
MRANLLGLPLGLVSILASAGAASFPYNPARIFPPLGNGSDLAYVFMPTSTAPSSFQLLSLNVTATLDSSTLPYSTVSASLPFLDDEDPTAFTPMRDVRGNINVYAGSCSSKSGPASVWAFGAGEKTGGERAWTQRRRDAIQPNVDDVLSGSNFLASGVAFSSSMDSEGGISGLYVFGGMCPDDDALSSSWTSAANYSNSLLIFKPSATDGRSGSYDVGVSRGRGPPVAEAGFSLTPLLPSILKSPDGAEDQQQNFVLLGGHTKEAFINMSQVALLSLPEESWSFLPVAPPSTKGTTELAIRRSPAEVEPRSGHTAVMTSDGKKIVMFGGWVGDVNNPADPQLAILELGDGYGGDGEWRWIVPDQTGSGLAPGEGIFGHAAALLPGDVMMVVGGYSIQAEGAKAKRADPALTSKHHFFNVTSHSWISGYAHPSSTAGPANGSDAPAETEAAKSGPLSTTPKKIAFGTGLVVGLAVVVGAVLAWWFCLRGVKRRRHQEREKELRGLGWTAHRFDDISGVMFGGLDGREAEKSAIGWMGPNQSGAGHAASGGGQVSSAISGGVPGSREPRGTEAERTGLLVEIPSPTRGLRKSLHSRGRSGERLLSSHVGAGYEDARRNLAGSIHPIDERDEYEQAGSEEVSASRETEASRPVSATALTAPPGDPFTDPQVLGVKDRGPGPPRSPARERELEVKEWVNDWAAAEALMHGVPGEGRGVSPERERERTLSMLSEMSARSTVSGLSGMSTRRSAGTVSRSVSQQSAGFFSVNPFSSATSGTSPTPEPARAVQGRSAGLTIMSKSSRPESGDQASFMTARSSFGQLQTEGEMLLPRPNTATSTPPDSPGSGRSKAKALGWMGSMRRALPFGADRSGSPSSASGRSEASSPSSSPRRHPADGELRPQRRPSGSGGAGYWRRKQGAADWDAGTSVAGSSVAAGDVEGAGSAASADEWDVEAAVERRVVQVMFTVPREKLRVVNGSGEDVDADAEDERGGAVELEVRGDENQRGGVQVDVEVDLGGREMKREREREGEREGERERDRGEVERVRQRVREIEALGA